MVSIRYRHHPWGSFVHVQGVCICIYVKKKMKRKEKISTCVYVHSILNNWVCILISEGHFYRVCLLLRVPMWALWDPMLFVFALSYLFKSKMSDLFLGTPGHCPFHYYFHYWCDFTSCLIWVDHHLSSYIHCFVVIFVIACDSSHSLHPPCSFLTLTYSRFDISLSSFWHISLSVWFASLSYYRYYVRIGHPQVHGSQTFLYMLRFIHEGMGFWSLGIWA